jgi:hypothetical protein
MNKIIEVALKGRFSTDDVTSLMDVVTATPNPEMATEILLGVYVKPDLPNVVVTDQGLEKTVVSVDYWTNYVTYSYQEEVRKQFYIDKDTDTSLITLDNYKDYERRYDDDNIRSFYLPTGEIKTRKSNCSFGDWLSHETLAV